MKGVLHRKSLAEKRYSPRYASTASREASTGSGDSESLVATCGEFSPWPVRLQTVTPGFSKPGIFTSLSSAATDTTPAGSVLTEQGSRIASLARSMGHRCETERGFTVCCSPVMEDLLMSVLSSLRMTDANVVISDDEYNIRMLREDRADIAIIDDPLYLFDADEFAMDEIGYMGMVMVDNGPSFIRYRYGAQRVAFMFMDSVDREYTVDAETFSLPELLGSNKSFFVEEYLLTRRNLRLKSAVDPKVLRHAITALYRTDGRQVQRLIAALKSRLS